MDNNAAIFYHPEGYSTSGEKLMGRHAAGEGFLNGFLRHAGADRFYAYAERREHFELFQKSVAVLAGKTETVWIPHSTPERLRDAGTLYIPGPDLAPMAWQRRSHDPHAWSITGVTHTICSDRIMDMLGNLLTAPVEPWDAIICTSRVVKSSIERLLASYGSYLAERWQSHPPQPRIHLPVIPLGVDCDAFAASKHSAKARKRLRAELGIAEGDIVVLFMGRLSYHAKAHPLPMYLGLEAAAQASGKKICLIQAGWFANQHIENEFVNGAREFCPSVQAVFLDGRKPEIRHDVWFAADIFVSLPDNIQETFGITPVEAMAAGLPAVVTDWDGYRDTVEEGITGYRIPTLMPAAGAGEQLAVSFMSGAINYDRYIGLASQCIAVDVNATAQVFTKLAEDADLRRCMGEAGRKRALAVYDWKVIIRQYQELWTELAARRKSACESAGKTEHTLMYPLRDDPYRIFSDYPTQVLTKDTVVSFSVDEPEKVLQRMLKSSMNNYATALFLNASEMQVLFGNIRKQGKAGVEKVQEDFPPDRHITLQRTLVWLMKLGIIKIKG